MKIKARIRAEQREERRDATGDAVQLLARVGRANRVAWPAVAAAPGAGDEAAPQQHTQTGIRDVWDKLATLAPILHELLLDEPLDASGPASIASAGARSSGSITASGTAIAEAEADEPDAAGDESFSHPDDRAAAAASIVGSEAWRAARMVEVRFVRLLVDLRARIVFRSVSTAAQAQQQEWRWTSHEIQECVGKAVPGAPSLGSAFEAVVAALDGDAGVDADCEQKIATLRMELSKSLPEDEADTAAGTHGISSSTTTQRQAYKSPSVASLGGLDQLRNRSTTSLSGSHTHAQGAAAAPVESDAALLALQHTMQHFPPRAPSQQAAPFDPFFIEHGRATHHRSADANAYWNPPSPTASIRSISSAWGYGDESGTEDGYEAPAGARYGHPRRPSSVVSDSPSLLFPSQTSSVATTTESDGYFSPIDAVGNAPGLRLSGPARGKDRRRVASMYGEPTLAVSPSLHSLSRGSGSTASTRPSRLAFLMMPGASAAGTGSSPTAAGALSSFAAPASSSAASKALRQFADADGYERARVPLNPATKLMRNAAGGGLRPRPVSLVHSVSETALAPPAADRDASSALDRLARHHTTPSPSISPSNSGNLQAQNDLQPPPSPARSTRSIASARGRAFAGLDPTHAQYGTLSASASATNSANSSQIDLATLARSGHTVSANGSGLDSALAAAEDASKLRTGGACSTCATPVVNGAVNRRGEIFCGRTCRLAAKAALAQAQTPVAAAATAAAGAPPVEMEKRAQPQEAAPLTAAAASGAS